jgi:hypothetical protein
MTDTINENIQKVKLVIEKQLHEINIISGINSLILSVCLVDTLAGFFCGYNGQHGRNKERYKKFTDKYLPEYSNYIYKIRCDLAHSFSNTLSKYYFIDNKEFTNEFGNSVNILDRQTFNIDHFRKALSQAINNYFADVKNNSFTDIQNQFKIRFDYSNILEDGVLGTIRNLEGNHKSKYEELDSLPGLDLKIAITSPIEIKK